MGMPVVTAASGGLPVVDVSATTKIGRPVSEAANGYGIRVTKVAVYGMPVVYTSPPLLRGTDDNQQADRTVPRPPLDRDGDRPPVQRTR